MGKQKIQLDLDSRLYRLLQRCSQIEEKSVDEILASLLHESLKKYSYNSLEMWEQARETDEMVQLVSEFENNENFDPNRIPFNTQILGLRKKLDDIEREIAASSSPRPDLEKDKFSIIENLNFAEKDALDKQKYEYTRLSEKWKSVCQEIPLDED